MRRRAGWRRSRCWRCSNPSRGRARSRRATARLGPAHAPIRVYALTSASLRGSARSGPSTLPRRDPSTVLAVVFGVLAAALLRRASLGGASGPGAGRRAGGGSTRRRRGSAFLTAAALALVGAGERIDPRTLWAFFVVGMIVPGVSQILFILAVRDAGPSRAAILIGTAPLISVLIALLAARGAFPAALSPGRCSSSPAAWPRRASAPGRRTSKRSEPGSR